MGIHKELIVFDAASAMGGPESDYTWWDQVKDGGLTAVAVTITNQVNCREAILLISKWYKRLMKDSGRLLHITDVSDFQKAKEQGKTGVLFQLQNSSSIENEPGLVEVLYRLGLRLMQLTYNERNLLGDGCAETTDAGLSKLGHEVILEMNRVGLVVDLAHAGYKTSMEAIERSSKPIICSHANVYSLCKNPRNFRDDQIRALTRKGGILGISAFPSFVRKERPTIEHMLDHVDYVCRLVGPQFVGLGLDFCPFPEEGWRKGIFGPPIYPPPPWNFPKGIDNSAQMPNITKGLLARGYSKEDIVGIMGGNFIRLFEQVWN